MHIFKGFAGILLLFAPLYLISHYRPELTPVIKDSIHWLPYAIMLIGLFLCVVFYNSREFCLLLVTGLCYWTFATFIWPPGLPDSKKAYLFNLISVLLPLNLMLYYVLKERGLLNRYGIQRIGLLAAQCLIVVWLFNSGRFLFSAYLNYPFIDTALIQQTAMQQPAMLIWLTAVMIILVSWLKQGGFMQLIWLLAGSALWIAVYSVFDILVAAIYISIAALVITVGIIINAYNLAYRDELTQLPSRRALRQQLLALGKSYTIAMVDVDHFKKLNDTCGHDVGDDVLKLLARQLGEIEGGGKPFRYGGEEFTVVFPGKGVAHAAGYLEDLRKQIASTPFIIRHKKRPRRKPEKTRQPAKTAQLDITVSIGVAEKQEKHKNPQDVIKSADNALYKAKQKGRNQVVIN